MITLLSPHYVEQETTRHDLAIAAMAFGFTLGFGFLTTWTAMKQTLDIGARYGIRRLMQPYIWMIWGEIVVCLAFGILSWLHLVAVISASFAFFFGILVLWTLQVHFLLQIIINRIAIILPSQRKANWLKFGVAVFILCINIAVYNIWIPARLQISAKYIRINGIWDRCEKVLYLLTDAGLNWYFIHIVEKELVEQGLEKYRRVVLFNKMIIGLSLSMDCLIIGMMSLSNSFVYMMFHPLAYIVKLNIEMSMANLIVSVSRETENVKLRRAALNGEIQYPLMKRCPKAPTHYGSYLSESRMSNIFESTWGLKSSAGSAMTSVDEGCELTRMDSQTWKKYMGRYMARYEGRYRYDIRAHTKTEVTVERPEEVDIGDVDAIQAASAIPSGWESRSSDVSYDALETSKRLGFGAGMGVRTEIWAPRKGG